MLTLTMALACGMAALAGGFIDAISGGGGLLTIPALLLAGVPPHIALGTNKVSACLGTSVALFNFSRNHLVDWRMALYGIGFSWLGSWLGSLLALHLDPNALGKILVMLLPIAMIGTVLPQKKHAGADAPLTGIRFWIILPFICFLIGAYDGFFGPATGTFIILALHWILGRCLIVSSATAKAFNLASNISAAVAFVWHGAIFWSLAIIMGCCFMAGNWLGSVFAIKIGAKAVRAFLLVSLFFLLATLVWRYFLAG